MHDDLYFIPILAAAAGGPQPAESFADAFERIRSVGDQDLYRYGLQQFELFVAVALESHRSASAPPSDTWAGPPLDQLDGASDKRAPAEAMKSIEPRWSQPLRKVIAELRERVSAAEMQLVLTCDGRPLRSIVAQTFHQVIDKVVPGHLRLATSSGWVIWEQALQPADLCWQPGHRPASLPMAAETGHRRPHRTIRLLSGKVILEIFRGPESGRIEIDFEV